MKKKRIFKKVKDYIGCVFGELVVIGEEKIVTDPSHKYATCRCTCGREQGVRLIRLIDGKTIKCRYCSRDLLDANDFIGFRVNKWTIVALAEKDTEKHGHNTLVVCRCDCGNEVIKPLTRMTNKNKNNKPPMYCADCYQASRNPNNYIGVKRGCFTILKEVILSKGDNPKGYKMVEVICECGSKSVHRLTRILKEKKQTKNCKECVKKYKDVGVINGTYFNYIEQGAKKRNFPFEISSSYINKLFKEQKSRCVYTGKKLVLNSGYINIHNRTASLDRIDSTKGYVEGNVQWIHKSLNMMKGPLSEKEFIKQCLRVADYLNSKTK